MFCKDFIILTVVAVVIEIMIILLHLIVIMCAFIRFSVDCCSVIFYYFTVQDMTSRDLLQQRMMTSSGDTSWRLSPLVTAALEGSLAVLDGLHRVNAGTFAVLHRSPSTFIYARLVFCIS